MIEITPDSRIFWENKKEIKDWLEDLGFDTSAIYKVKVIDFTHIKIFRYKLNDNGKVFLIEDNEVAKEDPKLVKVNQLPGCIVERLGERITLEDWYKSEIEDQLNYNKGE